MAKVYRFTLEGICPDGVQTWQTTQHYQTDVPIAGSEPSASVVLGHILDHYSSSGHNLSFVTSICTTGTGIRRAALLEEVDPGSGDVPDVAEETLSLAGVRTFSGDALPNAMCVWVKDLTGVALRSARGGAHLPPTIIPAELQSGGLWDSGSSYWTNVNNYCDKRADALDDVFQTTGDINPVVYSKVRRARSQSYTFEYDDCSPSTKVRWLRRRDN